jgi:hypothetical protein
MSNKFTPFLRLSIRISFAFLRTEYEYILHLKLTC